MIVPGSLVEVVDAVLRTVGGDDRIGDYGFFLRVCRPKYLHLLVPSAAFLHGGHRDTALCVFPFSYKHGCKGTKENADSP